MPRRRILLARPGLGTVSKAPSKSREKAQPSDTVLSGCPLIQGMTLERQFPCLSEMGVYSQHGIKYSPSCRVGKFSLIRRRVCAAEAVNTQTILQGRLQHVRIMHHDNSTDIFNVYQHVWRSYLIDLLGVNLHFTFFNFLHPLGCKFCKFRGVIYTPGV